MKKTLSVLLASVLGFAGNMPVLAGTFPVNPGIATSNSPIGSNESSSKHNNASRTLVLLSPASQSQILALLKTGLDVPKGSLTSDFFNLLTSSDKSRANLLEPRGRLVSGLIAAGVSGSQANLLVDSISFLVPFGSNGTPSLQDGLVTVDGTKLYQAITIYNSILDDIEKDDIRKLKLTGDPVFQAIARFLTSVRAQLTDTASR